MKIAFISDLHGNYTATQALEKALQNHDVDQVICLGDIVGKGPNSHLTMDWALANCDIVLGGNWDYGLASKKYPRDAFYWEQLGEERLQKLAQLPPEHCIEYAGNHIRCIHGRPIMEELLHSTADSEAFEALLNDGKQHFNVLIYGDMHRQLVRTVNGAHIINSGSVGNALGLGRVCYAILELWESGAYSIQLCSHPYNRELAVEEAKAQLALPYLEEYINEIENAKYVRRIFTL
ncbi:MAG: metallophosphoesterase family protein [Eubacteriales bacterium]|nr:metallophosphoesterase family protein [Eubacteriales bacterium]